MTASEQGAPDGHASPAPAAMVPAPAVHGKPAPRTAQELQDSIEQPARSRAQSGRRAAKASRPGCSS